jgi:hypothetical protein
MQFGSAVNCVKRRPRFHMPPVVPHQTYTAANSTMTTKATIRLLTLTRMQNTMISTCSYPRTADTLKRVILTRESGPVECKEYHRA